MPTQPSASAGLKAEPLSKFESGEYTGFLGSLYSAIKAYPQSQALADNPDTVQFWRPFVDLDTSGTRMRSSLWNISAARFARWTTRRTNT